MLGKSLVFSLEFESTIKSLRIHVVLTKYSEPQDLCDLVLNALTLRIPMVLY